MCSYRLLINLLSAVGQASIVCSFKYIILCLITVPFICQSAQEVSWDKYYYYNLIELMHAQL